jgi:hypothetical protein
VVLLLSRLDVGGLRHRALLFKVRPHGNARAKGRFSP